MGFGDAASVPDAWLARLQSPMALREHIGNTQRLRLGVSVGAVIWGAFAIADWHVARGAYGTDVAPIWYARFGIAPIIALFLWRMFRAPPPSPRLLTFMDIGVFATTSGVLGFMTWSLGGPASPYTPAVVLVLLCRGAFVVQRWREALLTNGISCAVHLLVLLLGVHAAGLQHVDGRVWPVLGLHVAYLATASALIVLSSHTAWSLRRLAFAQRRVGDYDLLRPLGQGGQADVWHAWHRKDRRDVALKLLTGQADRKKLVRFMREFDFLSELKHPHIVKVIDYGVSDEHIWYYAMELLNGKTLAGLVQTEGPLELSRAARLFVQVCSALSASHAKGVVHRDVKPENIFIVNPGSAEHCKLLDYGISRLRTQPPDQRLTGAVQAIGTPAFMPPELARGGPADGRSDVYSTAASLWFALTGVPPFEGDSIESTLRAHLTQDRAALRTRIVGSAGERVDALLRSCLAVDPGRRPADASALECALQGFCETRSEVAQPTITMET